MDNDEALTDDKITLMTLHGAKGLEFDTVFLPGWEEGLFPHQRALDEGGPAALEEERRLAYVGLTRARRRAFIFHAANRQVYGYWQSVLPSRFIKELPEENVEREAPPGLYGAKIGRTSAATATAWPSHSRRPAPVIDGAAYRVAARDASDRGFETGQRVFHQKFGYGRILAVDGDKLDIAFDKAGTKKVIQSFVEAA
jgi:DNA helicase-2/ATP-dependent DNA helicase PcrA